jgi:WD40 repeat protein
MAAAYDGPQGGVVLWDVARQERLIEKPLTAAQGRVNTLAYSLDGRNLAATYFGAAEARVVQWEVAARARPYDRTLRVSKGHNIRSVTLSPDCKTLAAGLSIYQTGGVELWNVAEPTPRMAERLDVPEGPVTCVAFSRDGKTLAAGCDVGPRREDGVCSIYRRRGRRRALRPR